MRLRLTSLPRTMAYWVRAGLLFGVGATAGVGGVGASEGPVPSDSMGVLNASVCVTDSFMAVGVDPTGEWTFGASWIANLHGCPIGAGSNDSTYRRMLFNYPNMPSSGNMAIRIDTFSYSTASAVGGQLVMPNPDSLVKRGDTLIATWRDLAARHVRVQTRWRIVRPLTGWHMIRREYIITSTDTSTHSVGLHDYIDPMVDGTTQPTYAWSSYGWRDTSGCGACGSAIMHVMRDRKSVV